MTARKKSLLTLLAYFAVASVVFGPYLANPFLMDDEIQILGNSEIQDLSHWPSYFSSSTFDSGGAAKMGGIYYKPVLTSYYALTWHFFGAKPAAFRLPILLFHVGSAWLTYLFLLGFFPFGFSLFGGLVFLVHPINSEVVAYIADAQDALYLFWGMLALVCAQRFRRGAPLYAALAFSLALSLLSKETGALFLGLVPFYCFLFRKELWVTVVSEGVAIAAAYAWLRASIGLTSVQNPVLLISRASYAERLLVFPYTVWHYIEVFFFPYRISTVTDFVLPGASLTGFWLPLAGVAVFGALLARLSRGLATAQRKIFLFAIGTLAAWLALHGNLLVTLDGTFADRWFYLAGVAFLLLGGLAVSRARFRPGDRLALACALYVFATLSLRTMLRLDTWSRPMELYQLEAAAHPWDAIMTNNVGVELFRSGRIGESAPYFERATELNPLWDVAWNNRGAVEMQMGRMPEAQGILEKAISLGTYPMAYVNYANLLINTGQLERCRIFLAQRGLRIFPQNPLLLQAARKVGVR